MANIKISELYPAGLELFYDSESFLNELGQDEASITGGGAFISAVVGTIGNLSLNSLVSAISNTINANSVGNNNSAYP